MKQRVAPKIQKSARSGGFRGRRIGGRGASAYQVRDDLDMILERDLLSPAAIMISDKSSKQEQYFSPFLNQILAGAIKLDHSSILQTHAGS
jgi:hypothetical protein